MIFNPVVVGSGEANLEICTVKLNSFDRGNVTIYYFDGFDDKVATVPGLGSRTINCLKNTIIATPQSIRTSPVGFNRITSNFGIVVANFEAEVSSSN